MNPLPPELKAEIDGCLESVKAGWCWPEKAYAMAQLVIDELPALVVEIGVFGGRSLFPQAMALRRLNRGVAIGIDPWRRESTIEGGVGAENSAWWSNLELHTIHSEFMDNLWRLDLSRWCLPWRCGAEECYGMFPSASIDILHIDGNHSELVSRRDVELFLPRVRSGGHVWFDDTNWDSTQAAAAILNSNLIPVLDEKTCRLYRKP